MELYCHRGWMLTYIREICGRTKISLAALHTEGAENGSEDGDDEVDDFLDCFFFHCC